MNEIRISYERLFNMGNFEHEKYTISKDAEGDKLVALKELALQIANFEEELILYRRYATRLQTVRNQLQWKNITSKEEEKWTKLKLFLERKIDAFKMEHRPLYKACKCDYCNHAEDDEYRDE